MPNPREYNPSYRGYNKDKKYFPLNTLEEIKQNNPAAAEELVNDGYCDLDYNGESYALYKDVVGNVYCRMPDSKLGSPGAFAQTSVCQDIVTGTIYALRRAKENKDEEINLKQDIDSANKLAAAELYPAQSFLSEQLLGREYKKEDREGKEDEEDDEDEAEENEEEGEKVAVKSQAEKKYVGSVQIMPLFPGKTLSSEYVNSTEKQEDDKPPEQKPKKTKTKKRKLPRADSLIEIKLTDEEKAKQEAQFKMLIEQGNKLERGLAKFEEIPETFLPLNEARTKQTIAIFVRMLRSNQSKVNNYNIDARARAEVEKEYDDLRKNKADELINLDSNLVEKTLEQMLLASTLSTNELKKWHANGFLHSDIKPENIIMDWNNKICNFCDVGTLMHEGEKGVLRINDLLSLVTTNPCGIGTVIYMAPELQDHYYKALQFQPAYIKQAEIDYRLRSLNIKEGTSLTIKEITGKRHNIPTRVTFQGFTRPFAKTPAPKKLPEIIVDSSSTARSILGDLYLESTPFVYSEKTDSYGLGISLEYVLSHKIQKIISGNMPITNEMDNNANALLPEKFNNPKDDPIIALINKLLIILHGLAAKDLNERWTLSQAIEQLQALTSELDKLKGRATAIEGPEHITVFSPGKQIVTGVNVEPKPISEQKNQQLQGLGMIEEKEEDESISGNDPSLTVPTDYTINNMQWHKFKSELAIHTAGVNLNYPLPYEARHHPISGELTDRNPFKVKDVDENTVRIEENVAHGYPVNAIEISNNSTNIHTEYPAEWFNEGHLTEAREAEIKGIISAFKIAKLGDPTNSKIIIGNCAGKPEVARLMYTLAKEVGFEPTYAADGSDPRGFFKRKMAAIVERPIFKRPKDPS